MYRQESWVCRVRRHALSIRADGINWISEGYIRVMGTEGLLSSKDSEGYELGREVVEDSQNVGFGWRGGTKITLPMDRYR